MAPAESALDAGLLDELAATPGAAWALATAPPGGSVAQAPAENPSASLAPEPSLGHGARAG